MTSHEDFFIGVVCALAVEVAAVKKTFDHVSQVLMSAHNAKDSNNYILGRINGHNIVLTFPNAAVYGQAPLPGVIRQMRTSFKAVRFVLMVGLAGGVPDTAKDIRLGDVVVSKAIAGRPSIIQLDADSDQALSQTTVETRTEDIMSIAFSMAMGKAETAAVFGESAMSSNISEIVQKEPDVFADPGPEQDILFEPDYQHPDTVSTGEGCDRCDPVRVRHRSPRESQHPVVHYGTIASSYRLLRDGLARDQFALETGAHCFETAAAGININMQFLVIRGICDYADSHRSQVWHPFAAAAAAAYAREILSFVPRHIKVQASALNRHPEALPVLSALLLTRPEIDRKSLIALKGRRVDGTCEWFTRHIAFKMWLADNQLPLLWISGGPGKGKTMLAIYISQVLQPAVDSANNVLLYYFCSNRDKNRNTAITLMRGIMHQWVDRQTHLARHIKSLFDSTETTKYTISSFSTLWRAFLTLLRNADCSQLVCVLDGLDECEKDSLKQLLTAIKDYLSLSQDWTGAQFKLIVLSRPEPAILEDALGQYQCIRLDEAAAEISQDVEKYIGAKVAELALEQNLSDEQTMQVQRKLKGGADGTFLWVGFVANELRGRQWTEMEEILRGVPKGLGGIYQRLLRQIEDKEALVPVLRWIVLAARPLSIDELTTALSTNQPDALSDTEFVRSQLDRCGLLVKIEGDMVNLVHESAKEFFQSDQVNTPGISMFWMTNDTHAILLQICLEEVECNYALHSNNGDESAPSPLLSYATQYWPLHFYYITRTSNVSSILSRPFFQPKSVVRNNWWKVYWEHEKNGGLPPEFSLLHLAAYLGNDAWATILIAKDPRAVRQKDQYGRTPLFWAVNRGHLNMVELLLDRGSRVNERDRSKSAALHIAIAGQHVQIVSTLLDHGARVESKSPHGDTPLTQAIRTGSRKLIQTMLLRGARVDNLSSGIVAQLKPTDPLEDRLDELLSFEDQIFAARYKQASREVDFAMKALSLCFRFPIIVKLVTLYLKSMVFGRWEQLMILQELVNENKADKLREWADIWREFFIQIVNSRHPGRLTAVTDLPTQIFKVVAPGDLQALLVISVLVGSETKLTCVRQDWREGDAITATAFAQWTAVAFSRGAEEYLHYGVREFLHDFGVCVESNNRADNVARTTVLFTSQVAMIETEDLRAVDYFSRAVAEFYQGYIGGGYEVDLFSDASQACAREFMALSDCRSIVRLHCFITSIVQFAEHCREPGQDHFLNLIPASSLVVCRENASAHKWVIGEAIPTAMSALIPKLSSGTLQRRVCKVLIECLIIGKQYGLTMPANAFRAKIKEHLHSMPALENMVYMIVNYGKPDNVSE